VERFYAIIHDRGGFFLAIVPDRCIDKHPGKTSVFGYKPPTRTSIFLRSSLIAPSRNTSSELFSFGFAKHHLGHPWPDFSRKPLRQAHQARPRQNFP
jgi:hypothetical protein